MPYGMMMDGHMGLMGYGWIFQLLILVLVVLIFWWLLRSERFGRESAQDIVKRRYAAGEITKKEYERLLEDLK